MRVYCDIWSGQLRRSIDGGILGPLNFYLRDILTFEVVFVDGTTPVTSTVLADSALLKVGIKAAPGASTILALASSYTLNDEVAVMTFSLNTAALVNFFSSNIPTSQGQANLYLEFEVTAADESARQTYHQSQCIVRREVNVSNDTNPPSVDTALYVLKAALFDGNGKAITPLLLASRLEITTRTGGTATALDAIVTTNLTVPFAVLLRIGGSGELWVLDTGTDAEDGTYIVRPDDYNAATNTKVWKRII